MGIKLNEPKEDEILAEINMTPLIDIMLVLLIIFMVTSSIALESGLEIQLPKTSSKTSAHEGKAVIVSLNKEGSISVQGKQVNFSDLKESIMAAIANEKSELVVFEGDSHSKLGMAIKIMDIAKSAGATRFAIAADEQ